MKKRILTALMVTTLSMSLLSGCGKTNGVTETQIVTDLKEPVTIEMWHYMNGKQAEVLGSIINDFNNTNDKQITVKAVSQGSIQDINKKVIAASQSKTLPAIINVYPDIATGLINENKIVNLTPFIDDTAVGMRKEIDDDFNKAFIDEVSQWGKKEIYGMPMTKSTEVVYVNKDMLEKLGYKIDDIKHTSIEKMAEISKKCKEQLGVPGFGFDSSSNGFISTLKMEGKDFVELEGVINVDNDWVRSFMNYYRDQVSRGYFRIPGEDKYLSGPFSNQTILAYQGSSAGAAHINNNGAFEIAVVEVPKFEGKDDAAIQQGGTLFVTSDVSKEQQYAAYEFIKFATSTENTAKFAVETGYLPVRKSAADTETMKRVLEDSNSLYAKVYPVAEKTLEYAYYTPAVNNAQSARDTVMEKFDAYVTGNINDIEVFIKDTQSQVETSIQRK